MLTSSWYSSGTALKRYNILLRKANDDLPIYTASSLRKLETSK